MAPSDDLSSFSLWLSPKNTRLGQLIVDEKARSHFRLEAAETQFVEYAAEPFDSSLIGTPHDLSGHLVKSRPCPAKKMGRGQ